jgi:hypothetical protein
VTERALTRAWVSAWCVHVQHPELAAHALETLPVTGDVHDVYREAIERAFYGSVART